ncbi:MAG: serine/threonine-protein kinase [Candidatus Krumholzibacteriota bacterium]|nr:serine/threonine-protein kinase [Candidatus Krumholzibacteriota bacterium]
MVGRTLAHYELLEKIGSGGMGDVYRAHDSRLSRDVALKILPESMASDPERRRRFETEAKAVAALKHPNIVTIHSVDESDGIHFITMELVEGKTLSQVIPPNGLTVEEFFNLSVPLADAVSAAHQKGITHRDLKPANIMIDNQGSVKVLDFGLAKRADQTPSLEEARTVGPDAVTQEGMVLGTVAYMSPEQAEGKPVDSRSDVFSLGIILYEMATGERPFKGYTNISTISSILRDDPVSVTDLNKSLPRHAGRIVKRCMAKAPDRRYQSVLDLRNDLEELQEEIASGETAIPEGIGAPPARSGRPAWLIPAIVASVAVLLLAFTLFKLRGGDTVFTPAAQAELVQITRDGKSDEAAISPDGRYVVYRIQEAGNTSLFVRQVTTGSTIEIVPASERSIIDPAVSPDGDFVYYIGSDKGQQGGTLYRVPILGGTSRKVMDDVNQRISFSPDGQEFVFLRAKGTTTVLMIAGVGGDNERVLSSRAFPEPYSNDPVWSPDGKNIAVASQNLSSGIVANVFVVSVEGGDAKPVASRTFFAIGEVAWLPDGSGIVFDASETIFSSQIYEVSFPGGDVRKVTNDLSSYHGVGLTADGNTLVTQQLENTFNVWTVGTSDGSVRQLTEGTGVFQGFGVAFTLDGRIVYSSNAGGDSDLWIMDGDGKNAMQLTTGDAVDATPAVSHDGRHIIWATTRAGGLNLWKMNLDGTGQKQLTSGSFEWNPQCSADGKWIVFVGAGDGPGSRLFRMPLAGGERELIIEIPATDPAISPDGKRVVFNGFDQEQGRWLMHVADLETGEVEQTIDTRFIDPLWSADGEGIVFNRTDEGAGNLWLRSLATGEETKITNFDDNFIHSYALFPDGEHYAMSRGDTRRDIVLLKNFR